MHKTTGVILLLLASVAYASRPAPVTSPDPVLERWRWRRIDHANGLAGRVYDLAEDRGGNIWIATHRGAQRYDGYRWQRYTTADGLGSDDLRALLAARDGSLWFAATDGTISRYHGGRWEVHASRLASDCRSARLFETADGDLLAAFRACGGDGHQPGRFLRLVDGDWRDVDTGGAPVQVTDLAQTADGALWIATWGDGLLRHAEGAWARLDSLTPDIGAFVGDIMVAADGTVWVAGGQSERMGIAHFDGSRWQPVLLEGSAAPFVWPLTLWQTRDGAPWLGSHGGKLGRFGDAGWSLYDQQQTPVKGPIQGYPSRSGDVWLYGRGHEKLFHLDTSRGWQRYTHPDGLYGGLEGPDGATWFHTRHAAVRFDGERWTELTAADGFLDGDATMLRAAADGSLWFFGHHRGRTAARRFDGSRWQGFGVEDGLPDSVYFLRHDHDRDLPTQARPVNFLRTVTSVRDGALWVAGQHGGRAAVARYADGVWQRFTVADGLRGVWASTVFEASDGTLWVGTIDLNLGYGLHRYDGAAWRHFGVQDGLPSDYITGLGEWPAGTLWVGHKLGVSRLDLASAAGEPAWLEHRSFSMEEPKVHAFTPTDRGMWMAFLPNRGGGVTRFDGREWLLLTEADGLADNAVSDILQARDGALWFAAQSGISRYDGETWLNTTAADGLEPGWMFPTLQEAADGTFWMDDCFGSVVHVRFRTDEGGPETLLEAAPEKVSSVGNILLRWRGSDADDGTPPAAIRYRWRLDGEPWSDWSRRTDVTYTSRLAGRHVFEVQSMDHDGRVDPTPAVHEFSVEAPLWRNPWVLGVTAGLVLLVLLQTTRVVRRDLRLSRQAESLATANQSLEAQADELHEARDAAEAANRAKSQFLANMSHEIRTPMNAVLGYAQILRRAANLPPEHRGAVDTIQRGGDHLLTLINDVLDLSKIEAGRMELGQTDFDLHDLLRGLAEMFALQCREKGLEWSLAGVPDGPLPVRGDEAKLRQVLINLLGNAVKFTPRGKVTLGLQRQGLHRYRFQVCDTGEGLSSTDVQALFQPFRQGSQAQQRGGTGLGLAISQRQVELMGGRIEVTSEPGQGSEFAFVLPLQPAQSAVTTSDTDRFARAIRLAPGTSVRALVVDDVEDNLVVMADMLRELGLYVDEARDGSEALARMRERRPDIVFVDVHMPVLGGQETLRRMRCSPDLARIRVVAISASVLEHERQAVLDAGFEGFLDKPLRYDQICATLDRVLGVPFVYAEPEAAAPPADWSRVRLPADIHARLHEAAELYSVTEMESYCRRLEGLGEAEQQLAAHLRTLMERHDMQGILSVLEEVDHG